MILKIRQKEFLKLHVTFEIIQKTHFLDFSKKCRKPWMKLTDFLPFSKSLGPWVRDGFLCQKMWKKAKITAPLYASILYHIGNVQSICTCQLSSCISAFKNVKGLVSLCHSFWYLLFLTIIYTVQSYIHSSFTIYRGPSSCNLIASSLNKRRTSMGCRESNSGLLYSKPMHYQLSHAAPERKRCIRFAYMQYTAAKYLIMTTIQIFLIHHAPSLVKISLGNVTMTFIFQLFSWKYNKYCMRGPY